MNLRVGRGRRGRRPCDVGQDRLPDGGGHEALGPRAGRGAVDAADLEKEEKIILMLKLMCKRIVRATCCAVSEVWKEK